MNHIRVTTTGQGRLYYSTRAEYYSADDKFQKTGNTSLNILREYFKLVPTKDGEKIVYDLAPFSGPAASGDTIAVRLTVTGSEWKYLMVEDPIPSGTEFIERDSGVRIEVAAAVVAVLRSRGANCMTTAWRSSRLTFRRDSSSTSIC